MRPEANYEKWMAMTKLTRGDKIKINSGEIFEFQSLKQKNFVGKKSDGTMWNVAVNNFAELVEKAVVVNKTSQATTLKTGELFYIIQKEKVLIFKFDYIKDGTIHSKNPVTNGGVRMDISMYAGKVSEL